MPSPNSIHNVSRSSAGDSDGDRLNSFLVRTATANDLPAISAIEIDSFTDPYPPALMERLQRDNPGNFFVAENNSSKIVGYCVASEKEEFAHLISIGVLREYRRKRVGVALLKTLLAWLSQRRVEEVWLEVKAGNGAAMKFYEQFGFEIMKRIENYYSDGSPALRMRLLMKEYVRKPETGRRGRRA